LAVEKEMSRDPKIVTQPPAASNPEDDETRGTGKPSGVRTASDEQFKKAHRKTSTLHAGLFRRLAK
jgi:hypothetical protein